MIKKTITYENFAGKKVTKDFWFHLSKVDGFELSLDGTFEARMRKAIQDQDKVTVFREFKKLIAVAIGVRSESGEDFSKPEAFRDAFMNSPAFDELIMDLFSDESKAAEFMAALFPKSVQAAAKKEMDAMVAKMSLDSVTGATNEKEFERSVNPFMEEPVWEQENRAPTSAEIQTMTREQLQKAFAKRNTWKQDS